VFALRRAVANSRVESTNSRTTRVDTVLEFHAATTGGSPALAVTAAAVSGRKGRDDLLARRCHTQTHALPSPSVRSFVRSRLSSLPLSSLLLGLVTSVKVNALNYTMREARYIRRYIPYKTSDDSEPYRNCPPTHLDARHKRRRVDSIDDGGAGRWWVAAAGSLVSWLIGRSVRAPLAVP